MSELEIYHCDEWHNPYTEFYLKSEADKVIAELEESHKKEVGQLLIEIAELKETLKNSRNAHKYWRKEYLIEYKECLHHKHKRCLAMAKWCFTKSNYHFVLARHGEDAKKNNRKSILYSKWHRRWLKLAENYKEGNV